MIERLPHGMKGEVRIYPVDSPRETIFEKKNVICNTVSFLFARLLSSNTGPVAGVWGLAVGAGGTGVNGWSPTTQPDPTALQTAMVSEIKRKQLAQVQYLDSSNNPTTTLTTKVNFTTVLNATSDDISLPIREMGLIGGGTTLTAEGGPTDMLTAPYFDPAAPVTNSVLLINYLTVPSFLLPAGVNIGIDWQLQF